MVHVKNGKYNWALRHNLINWNGYLLHFDYFIIHYITLISFPSKFFVNKFFKTAFSCHLRTNPFLNRHVGCFSHHIPFVCRNFLVFFFAGVDIQIRVRN
jgi:hypothetical protein